MWRGPYGHHLSSFIFEIFDSREGKRVKETVLLHCYHMMLIPSSGANDIGAVPRMSKELMLLFASTREANSVHGLPLAIREVLTSC